MCFIGVIVFDIHFVSPYVFIASKLNPYQFLFGQEDITILHWNTETFRDESLKSQQLVELN
jgi:hypothetical protein